LAATGVQVDEQVENGLRRVRLESGPARDFFLACSPDFQIASQLVGETTVRSFYTPEHEDAGRQALAVAAATLGIFNDKFGAYPYRDLDVVEAPMRNALGVEYPGIFLVAQSLYDTPEKPEFEVTTAHEVAHQWWYSVVGNDVFEEPWLDEALATYSSSLFYEYERGAAYAEGFYAHWEERYDRLLKEWGDERVAEDLAYFESLNKPAVYGGIVYTKGALFFRALRDEIGVSAFFQALRNYYQKRYFQTAHAEDLLSAFEQAAGRELDGIYQKWLYSK
jgi:aminopeptidase N